MLINNSLNSSAYAFSNYGANVKQQQKEQTAKSDKDGTKSSTSSTSQEDRTTYGTVALRLMSDEEYQAFSRATETLSTAEKQQYAQSVDSFTNVFLEANDVLSGKTMIEVLQNSDESFNQLQTDYNSFGGMSNVLDNAIKVIKSVAGSNNADIMSFINKFQATLSTNQLDLTV